MISPKYKNIAYFIVSSFFLSACNGTTNSATTDSPADILDYQHWIENLPTGYTATQGNAYLMQNTDCALFVSIFGSCFGQNPSAPYIIPQPPIVNSYVDPYYATQLETPGPDGSTDIFYRLSNNDALITIISYPPKAAYLGYQSYVFTRESSDYAGITPTRSRVISPDPSRYDIFGSMGNDINNVIVQNQYGISPWGGSVVMYITTSNQDLANALITNAKANGINPNSIFVEPVGSNVITGNDQSADDFITLMRYAVPESVSAASNWESSLSKNVLVYKVSNPAVPVSRYESNQYTAQTVNTDESSLQTALQQLSSLLEDYLKAQVSVVSASAYQTKATTIINPTTHIPESGLVGSSCIYYGTDCEGDNQDTSTYATLTESSVLLGLNEAAFIAGVNHSMPEINNNHYLSIDIYDASTASGVASASQTNLSSVGFSSGVLDGSAGQVLNNLGIAIPPADTELSANISKLYVTFIARDCNNSMIAAASQFCINLMGTSLVPLTSPISIIERSYVMPGFTTGGYNPEMVYPYIIAASHDFITNP